MNGREHPTPQGAFCPVCSRPVALTEDGEHLTTHSPAGDVFGTCPCTLPAIRQARR